MIRRYLWRHPSGISGLCSESIFLPSGLVGDRQLVCAFDHDLISLPGHASKSAIGVHQVEAVVAVVHELIPGAQIQERLNAQKNRSAGNDKEQSIH